MHRLSAHDLRRSRTHMTVLSIGWVLVAIVAGLSLLDPLAALDYSRPALWSAGYAATGLAVTILAGGVLVFLAPRVTLATSTACAVVGILAGPGGTAWWWAAGLTAAAMLAFVLVRDSRSLPRGDVVVPTTDTPFEDSWAATSPLRQWAGLGGVALVGVAGIVGLVLHQVDVASAAAFEAEASLVTVPITAIDEPEEGLQHLTVVIDGVEHEIESPWYEPVAIGDQVHVLTDGDTAVLAGAGQDNPAWILGLVAALPMVAAAVWGRYVAPGRRRARLVARGAPGVTVRVVCNGEIALVLPTDADWPALELTHLEGLVDRERVAAHLDAVDEWEPDDDLDQEADAPLPVTAMEVARWADDLHREVMAEETEVFTTEEKTVAEAVVGPDTNGAEPFILVGSWAHGSTVALARATGQVWLAEVEEPQPFKGRRRFLKAVRPDQPGWNLDEDAPSSLQEGLRVWAVRNARWTRWAAAFGVATAGAWLVPILLEEVWGDWFGSLRAILLALVVVVGPFWATSWSWWEFARFREGFGSYGLLLDDVVGPARVELIAPGDSAIGVRLREPEDLLSIDPAVIRAGAMTEAAAVELKALLDAAPPGARGGRRPTPALIATVLMLASWAVQLLVR